MVKRDSLKNGKRGCKPVDMERVYEELDSGRSVKSVANEWGVSVSTLYRRHKEYQAGEGIYAVGGLPPIPDNVTL